VPETPRTPFIRIARPYGSEKDFFEGDFGWLGRTTIILPNGPSRAAGELVRFEVVLSNGAPVLRGEGHVVAHHVPGGARPPGLEVRFTRVDAKSKTLLDRVRERRAALSSTGMREFGAPAVSVLPAVSMLPAEPPSPVASAAPAPPLGFPSAATASLPVDALPVLKPPTDAPSERSGVHLTKAASRIAPPANRDEILERLRARAKNLAAAGGLSFKKR
jgi:molecular chaperone DnaK